MKINCCAVCGGLYKWNGNNPEPFFKGRCCDDCDVLIIVGRMLMAFKEENNIENIKKQIQKEVIERKKSKE